MWTPGASVITRVWDDGFIGYIVFLWWNQRTSGWGTPVISTVRAISPPTRTRFEGSSSDTKRGAWYSKLLADTVWVDKLYRPGYTGG